MGKSQLCFSLLTPPRFMAFELTIRLQYPLGATECRPRTAPSDVRRPLPYTNYTYLFDSFFLPVCHTLVLASTHPVLDIHSTFR